MHTPELCSDWVFDLIIKELSITYPKEEIRKIFEIIEKEGLLEKVEIKKEQLQEAIQLKKRKNLPFNDLLHAILARDNGAIMVTRDKHFEEFEDMVTVRKPEDLI